MRFVCEHCGVEHQIRNPAMRARIEQRLQQGVVRLKCQHCDRVISLTPDKLLPSDSVDPGSNSSSSPSDSAHFSADSNAFQRSPTTGTQTLFPPSDGQYVPITRKAPLERISGNSDVERLGDSHSDFAFDESASGTFLLKNEDSSPNVSVRTRTPATPPNIPQSSAFPPSYTSPSISRPIPTSPTPTVSRPIPTSPTPTVSRPIPTSPTPVITRPIPTSPTPVITRPLPTPPAIPLAAQRSAITTSRKTYTHDFYLCSASGDPRFERFLLGALNAQYNVFAECDPPAGFERTPERFLAEACHSHVVIVPLSDAANHAEDVVLKALLDRAGQADGPESIVPLLAAQRIPPEKAPTRLRRMAAEVWEVGSDIQTIRAKLADYLEPGGGGRASTEHQDSLAQRLAETGRRLQQSIERGETNAQYQAELEILEQQARTGGLQPGATLSDRYRLERCIAEGPTTAAWRAFDRQTQSKVMVQVLQPAIINDAVRREGIFARIATCAHLQHPGIVSFLEPRLIDHNFYYFVTSYASSGTLDHAVQSGQILKRDAVPLLLELAQALAYAHQSACLHLDLGPKSVVIDGVGRLKICDFGLASTQAALQEGGAHPFARLAYLAPELFDENAALTPATDVYSLAMLGVFVLYGKELPNIALRAPERIARTLDCPASLRDLLAQALAFEPSARPANMEIFMDALRRL